MTRTRPSSDPDRATSSILVVDHEDEPRELLESYLSRNGYSVTSVRSGGRAMDAMSRATFAVLVTDVGLRGQSGVNLAEWVSQYSPDTEVVFTTSEASIESVARAVRIGAFDFLFKPFHSLERVAATVERALEKRQLQRELREANEALRVSRDELRAELALSERLASMGMLVAGIAHEIKNPLTYLLCNLEAVEKDLTHLARHVHRCHAEILHESQDGELDASGPLAQLRTMPRALQGASRQIRESLQGANRICEATRELGEFARSERGQAPAADLQRAMEKALDLAASEIRFRAEVAREFGDVPPARGSEAQLTQVFLNLLINAAHAIEEGDARRNVIRVRTWAEGDHVFAEVVDSGVGIEPDDLRNVFKPTYTTKHTKSGLGFGLSIADKVVRGCGGRIAAASLPGVGSRFAVRLRVAESTECPGEQVATEPSPIPPARQRRGRVLVIDDEEPIRRAIRRVVSRDHDVVLAESVAQARDILREDRRFDVILCDLMMPHGTGMDFHDWIHEHHPVLAGRVVFMTGGAFTPRARTFCQRVDRPFLDKPLEFDQLRSHIESLMELPLSA